MTDQFSQNFDPFQPRLPQNAVDPTLITEGLNPEEALRQKGVFLRAHLLREVLYGQDTDQPASGAARERQNNQVAKDLASLVSSLMEDNSFPAEHYLVLDNPIHQQALAEIRKQNPQTTNDPNRFSNPQ